MLAVDENYRKRKIGGTLVKKAIEAMIADTVDEVVLETEVTNKVIVVQNWKLEATQSTGT